MAATAAQSDAAFASGKLQLPTCLDGMNSPDDITCTGEEASKTGSARFHRVGVDYEDKRGERQKFGVIKFKKEKGVPDVGGLGWRSRHGHVLKNQSYYSNISQNSWNNPAHAGPKTWMGYHGPKLRSDAPLMEQLDRLDCAQAEWEVKKMYVNTIRVQTLDRFYSQKVQNEQREIHHSWAPQRRAKREINDSFDRLGCELDSMPMKELKKVLTSTVLKGDREAVRNITKRIQTEETWNAAWKEMEKKRREDTRADLEERRAYNRMLIELAGQPCFKGDPNHKIPNSCSRRIEELARPRDVARHDDVTQMTDFRGLVHCDNQVALEARFPGEGHELAKIFCGKASESAQPGWPPPPRPTTPHMGGPTKVEEPSTSNIALRRGSVPISDQKLGQALARTSDANWADFAVPQLEDKQAPPPPEQSNSILCEKFVNDPLYMSEQVSMDGFSENSPSTSVSLLKSKQRGDRPPPLRSFVYPVLVAVAPKKNKTSSRRLGGNTDTSQQSTTSVTDVAGVPIVSAPKSARMGQSSRRNNLLRYDVKVARLGITITGASNLRSDRSGNSDPFCVCRVPGRPQSKYQTRVINATSKPSWQEFYEMKDFYAGDSLEFSVYDKDVFASELLGRITLTQSMILPQGISGDLELHDEKRPESKPLLRVTVEVLDNLDPDGRLQASAQRGAEDSDDEPASTHEVCRNLDDFEAGLMPVPTLGNFWVTPRGDLKTLARDGTAKRTAMQSGEQQTGQNVVDASPTS